MESADVRYLGTRLFSQNSLAHKASLVRFAKTNSCVNIVRQHFPWWSLFLTHIQNKDLRKSMLMLQGHVHTFTWQFVKENESDQWEIGQKPVYNNIIINRN